MNYCLLITHFSQYGPHCCGLESSYLLKSALILATSKCKQRRGKERSWYDVFNRNYRFRQTGRVRYSRYARSKIESVAVKHNIIRYTVPIWCIISRNTWNWDFSQKDNLQVSAVTSTQALPCNSTWEQHPIVALLSASLLCAVELFSVLLKYLANTTALVHVSAPDKHVKYDQGLLTSAPFAQSAA